MKWFCARRKNRNAAWIAVAAALAGSTGGVTHHFLSGWWLAGLGAGVVTGVGIGMWQKRCS